MLIACEFNVARFILWLSFGIFDHLRGLVFMTMVPFSQASKPFTGQEQMCFSLLINPGKWAFLMLLPKPASLVLGAVFEVEGF